MANKEVIHLGRRSSNYLVMEICVMKEKIWMLSFELCQTSERTCVSMQILQISCLLQHLQHVWLQVCVCCALTFVCTQIFHVLHICVCHPCHGNRPLA